MEITGANDHIRIIGAKNSLSGWENFRNNLPELLQMIAALDQG